MGLGLRSQVALEFVLLISLAFMTMMVFAIVTRNSMIDLRGEEEYAALKDVMHVVQGEIIIAISVEDGYKRQFIVPLDLDGINYTIEISEGYLIGESKNHEYLLKVSNVNGSITKGINVLTKLGGAVYLNQ